MATISISILGLGRMGASMALALRRYNASKDAQHTFKIAGYERRGGVLKEARKLNLADDYPNSLSAALRDKDIIVIAMPYSDVQPIYEIVGMDARPGAVLLDTSLLKAPSLAWAEKHLGSEIYMVGITPILGSKYLFDSVDDTAHAREDLFDNGTVFLMPSVSCPREAVELANDFATLLGAEPRFMDVSEHDSLIAATEGVPALLGAIFYRTMYQSTGWGDVQRLTNPSFTYLTHHLFDTHPDDLRDLLMSNRESVVRYLDELMLSLRSMRQALAQNDRSGVEAGLVDSAIDYEKWLNRRHKNEWDEKDPGGKAAGGAGDVVSGLFGSFVANRLRGNKK